MHVRAESGPIMLLFLFAVLVGVEPDNTTQVTLIVPRITENIFLPGVVTVKIVPPGNTETIIRVQRPPTRAKHVRPGGCPRAQIMTISSRHSYKHMVLRECARTRLLSILGQYPVQRVLRIITFIILSVRKPTENVGPGSVRNAPLASPPITWREVCEVIRSLPARSVQWGSPRSTMSVYCPPCRQPPRSQRGSQRGSQRRSQRRSQRNPPWHRR